MATASFEITALLTEKPLRKTSPRFEGQEVSPRGRSGIVVDGRIDAGWRDLWAGQGMVLCPARRTRPTVRIRLAAGAACPIALPRAVVCHHAVVLGLRHGDDLHVSVGGRGGTGRGWRRGRDVPLPAPAPARRGLRVA